ncbi:MAG: adenosine deaminase [Acidimicrobiia bacterium]
MDAFLRGLPKAELHVHIEGTLEPDLLFALARRNGVPLRYPSVEALQEAYEFVDLQSFLDIYYEGADVLRTEQDFYDLTWAYLQQAAADGVVRAEIFFDPQTHTARGIPFETVLHGIVAALDDGGSRLGVSSGLIMCFLRHLPAAEAMEALHRAAGFKHLLLGVGLDSSEVGHPPAEFVEVFRHARELGLHVVAHAGEEGPPEYVWQALDLLGAERIDHGVRSVEEHALVERLARDRVPLTVCPLSNIRLKVFDRLEDHPLASMMDAGLRVTVNSDDPAYFGGYIGDNYVRSEQAMRLGRERMVTLARTSLESSFLADDERARLIRRLDEYLASRPSEAMA